MTTISIVKDMFLSLIDDVDLALLSEDDLEHLMDNWLKLSIMEFHNCKKDLTITTDDSGEMTFNDELNNEEIGILAYGMLLAWLEPKIRCWDTIKQHTGTSDFNKLSNANILLRLNDLQERTEIKLRNLKARYHSKDLVGLG